MVGYKSNAIIAVIKGALFQDDRLCANKNSAANGDNTDMVLTKFYSYQLIDLMISYIVAFKAVVVSILLMCVTAIEALIKCLYQCLFLAGKYKTAEVLTLDAVYRFRFASRADFKQKIKEDKRVFMFYSISSCEFECAFFDLVAWTVASPNSGVHLDKNNSNAIGKRFAPLV